MIGYALLGATWLVMKTEGELRDQAYRLSWALLFAMLGAIGAVSLATPFLHVQYTQRWFAWPNIILTAPVPIAVAGRHRAVAAQPRAANTTTSRSS